MSNTPDYVNMRAGEMLAALGTDGSKWADAFCQQFPDADYGLMLGWFCNAIEATKEACRK